MAIRKPVLILGAALWAAAISLAVLMVMPRSATPSNDLPILYEAPSFSLTSSTGETVGSDTLRGTPYVLSLVFSECPGACPMMTAKLKKLQDALPDERVKIVSITVDPEKDTPEVLREYASELQADPQRWHFLTGPSKAIFDTAAGFRLSANPRTADALPGHSERFLLVDAAGKVRGFYNSADDNELTQLTRDAAELAAESR